MEKFYCPTNFFGGIELRPMEALDEAAFRTLYAETREPELQVTAWSPEEKRAFCNSQYCFQDFHYRKYYAEFEPWAICMNGAVIGRLYLARMVTLLALMDITLATAHRGKGIGTALLQDLLQQADRQQLVTRLQVEPNNPARRLYRRLGFVEVGEVAGAYQEMRRQPNP